VTEERPSGETKKRRRDASVVSFITSALVFIFIIEGEIRHQSSAP